MTQQIKPNTNFQSNEFALTESQLEQLYHQVLTLSATGENQGPNSGITLWEFVSERDGSYTAEEIAADWDNA